MNHNMMVDVYSRPFFLLIYLFSEGTEVTDSESESEEDEKSHGTKRRSRQSKKSEDNARSNLREKSYICTLFKVLYIYIIFSLEISTLLTKIEEK